MNKGNTLAGLFCLFLVLSIVPVQAADKIVQHETEKKDGHLSQPDTGHVVSFNAPRGTWWIKSVEVYGSRYGGGYDPAKTFFTLAICDTGLDPLTSTEVPYANFKAGKFDWVECLLSEPVKAPRNFKVAAAFNPTGTRGVFVGWSSVGSSHSGFGLPGGSERPLGGKDWMIRVRLTKKKPKVPKKVKERFSEASVKSKALYMEDFRYVTKTVKANFPAFKKKKVDWTKVCREHESRFRACSDDAAHILNVERLLAVLKDSHTGVTRTSVDTHIPSFDGLHGGGLWIASDRNRLVLRAIESGRALEEKLKPGALLLRIGERPAKLVHREVRQKAMEWSGWSSPHFLDSRLSFTFFPLEDDRLSCTFMNPDGKLVEAEITGRESVVSRVRATLPEGVVASGSAAALKLDDDIGYIRITGSMNDATRTAFHDAFDTVRGVKCVILDCRGMGGGGDGPAWNMAGRFYSKPASLGRNGMLMPSGSWQFDGPLVMLQDEREISSAETFTWAMTETGRAVSVGRPTGGATIIPRSFDAPSGLFSFRLGCTDRPTPLQGIKPEGIGTRPDIFVPYEPILLERFPDPAVAVARDVLLLLAGKASRSTVVDYYGGILGCEPARVKKTVKAFGKIRLPSKKSGFCHATDDLVEAMVKWQIRLCNSKDNPMPDFAGAAERLSALQEIARLLGSESAASQAAGEVKKWAREIKAQEAFEAMIEKSYPPDERALKKFLGSHGNSRYGKTAKRTFPR